MEKMDGNIERFPDGTVIDAWFYDARVPEPAELGREYVLTDYGIYPDERLHTREIQALIERVHAAGGGALVVPEGTFRTGALFFRPGVNLRVAAGGTLLGSDDIGDYPVLETRIEGETCKYFAALINADHCDGFTMLGPGTIDGNGHKAWRAFWLRRAWNPACTNKDEQRPRLVYISNSQDVRVCDLRLQNAAYWTNHLYRCRRAKFLGCRIYSPYEPVKAPSTDAIDLDVCEDVLIKHCYMHVNDDAVALKGGKGPWADQLAENGGNARIIIEDCRYGFCHGCLTLGSEAIDCRNVLLRRVTVDSGFNLLWIKLRPDTPQRYEYIAVEDVRGEVRTFLDVYRWTQFFDLKGREDLPRSRVRHIAMRRCQVRCETGYYVSEALSDCDISDFEFDDLDLVASNAETLALPEVLRN